MLATPRLVLHPCARDHRAPLLAIFRDPYVRRYLWDSRIVAEHEVDGVLAESDASFASHGVGLWCASEREPHAAAPCGFAGARPGASGDLELIYGFLPAVWGRGYALEATRAVLARAFAAGQARVWASTDLENRASEKVMRRLGMRFHRRERVGGLPQVFYVIAREEFRL
jgi:ribosomal-protein-alanine N-acetyltransferase